MWPQDSGDRGAGCTQVPQGRASRCLWGEDPPSGPTRQSVSRPGQGVEEVKDPGDFTILYLQGRDFLRVRKARETPSQGEGVTRVLLA